MAEARTGGEMKRPLQYGEFQHIAINREVGRFPGLHQWVNESIARLPEMDVRQSPLTNDKWKAETSAIPGEIERIKGSFFTIEGVHVATPAFSWNQPAIQQSTGSVEIPTPEGLMKADISGIVGIIQDASGNVLLTMGQEPLADTPKHALVRTPMQTSATKFADIMNGDVKKDPAFVALLEKLFGENPFEAFKQYLTSGDVRVWPLAAPDANRLRSLNIGITFTVADAKKQEALVADGKNRWVSKDEIKALELSGLLNGHTVAAIASVQ